MIEPVLTQVQVEPFADVLVLANVTGVPDVVARPPRKRVVRVAAVEIRYVYQFERSRWDHAAKLLGYRVQGDGTVGTSPSSVGYGPDDEMPDWLARVVDERRPAFFPPNIRVRP